jgi:hypothetical protein
MSLAESPAKEVAKLPEMLRPLFWDCDFDRLDWLRDRDFVTGRILVHGPWEAICWLRGEVGDEGVRDWIVDHEGRELSRQQIRFWELILDLPADLVATWLQSESRKIWEGRIRR